MERCGAEGAKQEDVIQMHCGKCRILKLRVLTSALGTKTCEISTPVYFC